MAARVAALARALAAGLAVTLAAGVAAAAAPASATASGWHVQQTPNPPAKQGVLTAVSCASPTACMAVGSHNNGGGFFFPLAETWNGTAWSVHRPPAPADAQSTSLLGVSCLSASACMAVGDYRSTAGIVKTLAEAWNGSSWSVRPTPNPAGSQNSGLASVSCTSATACTAVGFAGQFGETLTLAEAWNGTSWSIQPTPNPAGATAVPLAETWNGTSWSIRMPIADGPGDSTLTGVSCISASDCIAVGSGDNTVTSQVPLAERWDGTSWSVQPVPVPAGTTRSFFQGVSCTSASACTAVGHYDNASGKEFTLAEAWNGTSWSIQPTPNRGNGIAGLLGVSCTAPGACTAVGFYDTRSGLALPLAEVWNGTSWSVQAVPKPQGSTATFLNGVACSSAGVCTAVGERGTQVNNMGLSSNQTLAEAEP